MAKAKNGDTVKVHYTGSLEDGKQFDSSVGGEPLEFKLGGGQLIPGFEKAVAGMAAGDSKQVKVDPKEAYGDWREELVMVVDPEDFPDDLDPSVGDELEIEQDGQAFVVLVTNVSEEGITLDANHPLAGKTLVFDLELVEIL